MIPSSLISLLTDFGTRDAFVGIMKGVIFGINSTANIVDLSHEVPAQDVLAGALILRSAVRFFPPGTIYLAIVDPGVGSAQRAIIVETRQHVFIGPDNGLLSLAVPEELVLRIIHVTNDRYFLPQQSNTFHGRDIFAPVAAHVSRGVLTTDFGPEVSTIERVQLPTVERGNMELRGCVIYIDHFGNAITNVTMADLLPFLKQALWVSIANMRIHTLGSTYASVAVGAPVALINSWGLLEIAVRNGSAARQLRIEIGCRITVTQA